MKKVVVAVLVAVVCAVLVWAGIYFARIARERRAPRESAIHAVEVFEEALRNPEAAEILDTVVMPLAQTGRTVQEQEDFLRKALRDEVSAAGLAVLKETGEFGNLNAIFPDEASKWAKVFGVKTNQCVAFHAERNGIRAEVVLYKEKGAYRLLRCNNVKQLAMDLPE